MGLLLLLLLLLLNLDQLVFGGFVDSFAFAGARNRGDGELHWLLLLLLLLRRVWRWIVVHRLGRRRRVDGRRSSGLRLLECSVG